MLHQAQKSKNGQELVKSLEDMERDDSAQFLLHLQNFSEENLGPCIELRLWIDFGLFV